MPIKPGYSPIILTDTATGGSPAYPLFIDALRMTEDSQPFQRVEYSNQLLRGAPEADGSLPTYDQLIGGKIVQIRNPQCNWVNVRSTATDDLLLDSVYRRWDIRRWEIQGAPSNPTNVQNSFLLHRRHKALLNLFDFHQQVARGYVSWTYLTATLQAATFTSIQNTGISFSGQALGTGVPYLVHNVLVVSFVPDVDAEVPLNSSANSSLIQRSFSMVLEQRMDVPASQATFGINTTADSIG